VIFWVFDLVQMHCPGPLSSKEGSCGSVPRSGLRLLSKILVFEAVSTLRVALVGPF